MANNVTPTGGSTQEPAPGCTGCEVPPASADPAQAVAKPSRRGFLRSGGMISLSGLMGTATLMAQTGDQKAATDAARQIDVMAKALGDELSKLAALFK